MLNDAQLLRYSRHILLPEVGVEGQERIGAAAVLVVGAGGLGARPPSTWEHPGWANSVSLMVMSSI
jgi:hypothetical protein